MNVFQIHVDDLWAFVGYYLHSLAYCLGGTSVMGVLLLLLKRSNGGQLRFTPFSWLLLAPLLIWLFYFTATAREAFTITSLDTENDVYAEVVYKSMFDVDLKKAVRIAVDGGESGNVRFYASCRIADILVTNDNYTKAIILEKVRIAPEFRTGFFKTNLLTCGFFIPNYAEGPFTVKGIIERRLQTLEPNTPTNASETPTGK